MPSFCFRIKQQKHIETVSSYPTHVSESERVWREPPPLEKVGADPDLLNKQHQQSHKILF